MRLRGRAFREITLEWAIRLGATLGRLAGEGGLVVSGRDVSPVSRAFKRAISAGVMSAGAEVMDFHESLTGEISFAMKRFGCRMGFMVVQDPVFEKNVMIRVYKTPGYELTGRELEEFVREIGKELVEPRRVGWISYAEYMHKLYVSAVSSFIKSDTISSAKIRVALGPGLDPLDSVFRDLSSELDVEHTVIGVSFKACLHPFTELMENVEKVANAVRADVGVAFSHDGSTLAAYVVNAGYLLPGELALILTERYPTGSKILVSNPTPNIIVKALERKGLDVILTDSPEAFSLLLRKERPVLAMTYTGEIVTPVFSLGCDAVVAYAQLLEVVSELRGRKIVSIVRNGLRDTVTRVSRESAQDLCRDKGAVTAWGCVVVLDDKVIHLVYQPSSKDFLALSDLIASV